MKPNYLSGVRLVVSNVKVDRQKANLTIRASGNLGDGTMCLPWAVINYENDFSLRPNQLFCDLSGRNRGALAEIAINDQGGIQCVSPNLIYS